MAMRRHLKIDLGRQVVVKLSGGHVQDPAASFQVNRCCSELEMIGAIDFHVVRRRLRERYRYVDNCRISGAKVNADGLSPRYHDLPGYVGAGGPCWLPEVRVASLELRHLVSEVRGSLEDA